MIAIAYGPLVAFGLLNFIIGNRAIFYSAPIMWFGAIFLMTTTARFVAANLSEIKYLSSRDQTATILASSLAIMVTWVNSPTDYVPRPSFPRPVLEGFASLKVGVNPANSVVAPGTMLRFRYCSITFRRFLTVDRIHTCNAFCRGGVVNKDQDKTVGN